MSRKKLSEYRAKHILAHGLDQTYEGWEFDLSRPLAAQLSALPADGRFVAKVDQAIKGRFKKGLVLLDAETPAVQTALEDYKKQGFRYALVEPYRTHESSEERYVSLERKRDGVHLAYSANGGVDVEQSPQSVVRAIANSDAVVAAAKVLGVSEAWLERLVRLFNKNHLVFLEVNPLVVQDLPLPLDAAVEVDDVTAPLSQSWSAEDTRSYANRERTPEEDAVDALSAESQASFSLEVLNPDAAVFMLLSSGGASVVLADEVNNLGYGKELGNYGEYSGNPSQEETLVYARQVLSLLLKSKAKHKVLVVAGGVANFTDVRATFKGVIAALHEREPELKKQGIKVYVRRGGPHEQEGLAHMREYLAQSGLLGAVHGPELVLTDVVGLAIKGLEADRG